MRQLISGILATNRSRSLSVLALTIGVGLAEGVAVLLLLPLLRLAGVEIQGSVSGIAGALGAAFTALGIRPTLFAVLLLYVVVAILEATLIRARTIVDARVVQDYALGLRTRLYSAIARAEWLVLSRIRSSDFTFALTTAVDWAETGAHNILFFLSSSALALVYIALAIGVSPEMSGIILVVGGSLLMLERARIMRGRGRGRDVTATATELHATAAEQLAGLKTAKSYGQEGRHLEIFLDAAHAVNRANLALMRAFASLRWRLAISSVLALSVILYLAVNTLRLPTAAILLLLFIFSRLIPRLVALQQTFQEIQSALPALEAITRLVEECEAAPEHPDSARQPIVLNDSIALRGVSFRYDADNVTEHLSAIDIVIPAGRTSAIVGGSGAGKSTLADLLLGLIHPHEGELLIGSVPLDRAHLDSWRSQIGYVAQDTFLFNDTVRANLEWARPASSEVEMVEALEHAAADFVLDLPNGIDTVIGERGVRLSGGERQRLSLARAILRKPRLLILDEATSSLDSENEERIYAAIQRLHGEMTIVVITHRLSTIRNADVINVLDRGRLVASGSWDELVGGENGRFRDLCRAQGIVEEGIPVGAGWRP